eukprot:scaffold13956_cov116-Isochrysis_galbana.AAC.1
MGKEWGRGRSVRTAKGQRVSRRDAARDIIISLFQRKTHARSRRAHSPPQNNSLMKSELTLAAAV